MRKLVEDCFHNYHPVYHIKVCIPPLVHLQQRVLACERAFEPDNRRRLESDWIGIGRAKLESR